MKVDGKELARMHAKKAAAGLSEQVSDQAVEGGADDDVSEPEHIQHMMLLMHAMDKKDAEMAHKHMMDYADTVARKKGA